MKIDYFENLEELSNFDEIQISDNLNIKNNINPKKKILLIYPNISHTNKKFENISIKNLALSFLIKITLLGGSPTRMLLILLKKILIN